MKGFVETGQGFAKNEKVISGACTTSLQPHGLAQRSWRLTCNKCSSPGDAQHLRHGGGGGESL